MQALGKVTPRGGNAPVLGLSVPGISGSYEVPKAFLLPLPSSEVLDTTAWLKVTRRMGSRAGAASPAPEKTGFVLTFWLKCVVFQDCLWNFLSCVQ